MIVKTYDPVTFKEKETVTNLESIIYNKRFYKTGSFEIQTTSNAFKNNDIIAYKVDNEIRSGIVMKIIEKNNTVNVLGSDLKALLDFRYITSPTEYQGSPGEIIKQLVAEYLLTDDRAVDGFKILSDVVGGEDTVYTPEQQYLNEAIEKFSFTNEIGIGVEFNLKEITFQLLKGQNKSKYIKFGREYHNIESVEYTNDIFNTYNVGYSYDDNSELVSVGDAKGILRRECFKDKNIEEYLAEKAPIETLRAEANSKYKYGVDYNLGDYVTVIHDNVETVKQITEIKEVYEKNKKIIIPVFGTEKENPIKKLLKGG